MNVLLSGVSADLISQMETFAEKDDGASILPSRKLYEFFQNSLCLPWRTPRGQWGWSLQ